MMRKTLGILAIQLLVLTSPSFAGSCEHGEGDPGVCTDLVRDLFFESASDGTGPNANIIDRPNWTIKMRCYTGYKRGVSAFNNDSESSYIGTVGTVLKKASTESTSDIIVPVQYMNKEDTGSYFPGKKWIANIKEVKDLPNRSLRSYEANGIDWQNRQTRNYFELGTVKRNGKMQFVAQVSIIESTLERTDYCIEIK